MAGIVSAPLPFLRKSEDPKPLHPRWGDVDISVPTEGSWNQYDNPHRAMREPQSYGPGFVPGCCPYEKEITNDDHQDGKRSHPTTTSNDATSSSRRNSLALGALRPGRLSVRLASRPKHLRRDSQTARQSQLMEPEKTEFAYKPIQQDYTAEAIENASQYQQQQEQQSTRFKYIPTNGRYLEQLAPATSPSQSVNSYRSSSLWRNSTMESLEGRGSGRDLLTTTYEENIEDDRRSLRSSVGGDSPDSSTGPGHPVLPIRRKTSPQVVTDRKRFSLLKPMTTAMVPAMDDLYE